MEILFLLFLLICLLICFFLWILPILLLRLWIRTTRQVWNDGRKKEKVTTVFSLMLCIVATITFCVCIYLTFYESAPPKFAFLYPAYYIFVALMFAFNGILMRRDRKYWVKFVFITIICIIGTYVSSFGTRLENNPISKQSVTFKNKEDIEERLHLKGFPSCTFVKAFYSPRDFGGIRVVFKYDGVDSVSVFRSIKQLYQKHPLLAYRDMDLDVCLKYGTIYNDKNDNAPKYANIYFFNDYHDGFALVYGDVSYYPPDILTLINRLLGFNFNVVDRFNDEIQTLVKSSLGCTIPKCKTILSYESDNDFPDYRWKGFFSLDRPLCNSDIRKLRSACEYVDDWKLYEEDGDIVIENNFEGDYVWHFTFIKDKKGNFSFVEVEYIDY